MTLGLNRHVGNGADTTIVRAFAQSVAAAATQVLNAFACIAPALASNPARGRAPGTR